MNPLPPGDDHDTEVLVGQAADEYTERLQRGERPDVEAFARRFPPIADLLRQILPVLRELGPDAQGRDRDEAGGLGRGKPTLADPPPLPVRFPGPAPAAGPGRSENGKDYPGPIGDFRILRLLARGGMGIVYEAVQESLGRHVALKVLPLAARLDDRHLQRFKNEAQAAARLHHPNIVPVFAVGCAHGVHYYAMQFIEGQTLAALVEALRLRTRAGGAGAGESVTSRTVVAGPPTAASQDLVCEGSDSFLAFSWSSPPAARPAPAAEPASGTEPALAVSVTSPAYFRTVAQLGLQAAEALDHAHGEGIVHRDVTPSNLMLDGRGNLWVTDFGLALSRQWEGGLTLTGDLVGTLRYMSPEQALARPGLVDHRTDVYGLGATLYELLTLERVFTSQDRQELLRQILSEEPRPPRRLNRALPVELETIVLKALEKDPRDRYAGARDMAEDLRLFLEDRPIRARRPSVADRLRKWARRNQAVVAAATLAFALAFAALAVGSVLVWAQRQQTLAALGEAQTQRGRALDREAAVRRQLYAYHVHQAHQAWGVARPSQILEVLGRDIPEPGQEDVRGFAWYYLRRLCRGQSEPRQVLRGHAGDVFGARFSPDGKLLASVSRDRTLRLWDAHTGEPFHTLRGHTDEVNWAAFAPDGRTLATASDDHTVRLWDVATGRHRDRFGPLPGAVVAADFSPDGTTLAAGTDKGTVHRWDLRSRRELPPLQAHRQRIEYLAYSPDGRFLATTAEDARVWDVAGDRLHACWRVAAGQHFTCVAFAPRERVLATACTDSTTTLWDLETGKARATLRGHSDAIQSVAFCPDGLTLATASNDGAVRLWDVRTGKMCNLLTGHVGRVWCVAYAPDGRTLASAGQEGTVRLWDPAREANRRILTDPTFHGAPQLGFSPDGSRLVALHQEGLRLWDPAAERLVATAPYPVHGLALAVAPVGNLLATCHEDGKVRLWDLADLRERGTWNAFAPPILGIGAFAFSPDGQSLFTHFLGESSARLWDVSTGRATTIPLPVESTVRAAVSPDARAAFGGTPPDQVTLWDLGTSLPQTTFRTRQGEIRCVALSPDGRVLASGGSDWTLKLWDLETGQVRAALLGHGSEPRCLAFGPEGKTLASGSKEGRVKLWHVSTGQELLTLEGHRGPVASVAFAPDGRLLASGSHDPENKGEIFLWLTESGTGPGGH